MSFSIDFNVFISGGYLDDKVVDWKIFRYGYREYGGECRRVVIDID